MSFLYPEALAETTATSIGMQSNMIAQLLSIVGLIAIFYFLFFRPQMKRAKEHRNLMANLAPGDTVTTTGGLIGTIIKIQDNFIQLEIASGVEVVVQKVAITTVLPTGSLKSIHKA